MSKLEKVLLERPELTDMRVLDPNSHIALLVTDFSPELESPELHEEAELAFAVLNEKPSDNIDFEGRGTYHDMEGRFLYVKGIGSPLSFESEEKPLVDGMKQFPAFGGAKGSLFFDPVILNAYPRTLGTHTDQESGLEFINAYLVFKYLAGKYGIGDIQGARNLGVSVPIAVAKFPELSSLVSESIEKIIQDEKNPFAKSSMEWKGNLEGIGSVVLEIPARARLNHSFDNARFRDEDSSRYSGPEDYIIVARTVRELLGAGFVYCFGGTHMQNIYNAPNSICAQADNADLLHLGNLEVMAPSEDNSHIIKEVSVADQQLYMIQLQLRGGFIPQVVLPDDTFEFCKIRDKSQQAFYMELFDGDLTSEQVSTLVRLLPMYNEEISTAMAVFLHEKYKNGEWLRIGKEHSELMHIFPGVDMSKQYKERKRKNFEWGIPDFLRRVELKKEAIGSFLKFMSTARKEEIDSIPDMCAYESLRDKLVKHPDHIKERILRGIYYTNSSLEQLRGEKLIDYWYNNRGRLFEEISSYLDEDAESAASYAENIYSIIRVLGIARRDYVYSDVIDIIADKNWWQGPGDKVREAAYKGSLEILNFVKPDKYGLPEGIERQKYLINCARFADLGGGFTGILENAFDDNKSIYDLFEERGLRNPHEEVGWYFRQIFYSEQFEQMNKLLEQYFEIISNVRRRDEMETAISQLDLLAEQFDSPAVKAWHYDYIGNEIYGKSLNNTEKKAEYRQRVIQEVDMSEIYH